MNDLFNTAVSAAPVAAPKEPREPLVDQIEQHFRLHRYESFTGQDLFLAFPERRQDSIRTAIRKLLRERTIKSTGMVKQSDKFPQPQPLGDVVCFTLILGK